MKVMPYGKDDGENPLLEPVWHRRAGCKGLRKLPFCLASDRRTRPVEHEKLFVLPDYTGLDWEIRSNGAKQRRAGDVALSVRADNFPSGPHKRRHRCGCNLLP